LNVDRYDFIVLITIVQLNYKPLQLWYGDGKDDDDGDDFEEIMNEVYVDEEWKNSSNGYDFEDDDSDGDDDWFACMYLNLVYNVCFGFMACKIRTIYSYVMVFRHTGGLSFNILTL